MIVFIFYFLVIRELSWFNKKTIKQFSYPSTVKGLVIKI